MKIESICIVGGGNSGWMMATALSKNCPSIDVTLVESPTIKTIGVGEATVPYTSVFIKEILGFDEEEWMPFCDASYKASIRFTDFYKKGNECMHAFWTKEEESYNVYDWLVKRELTQTPTEDYYASNYIAYHMVKGNKFDRLDNDRFSYAHHMDATKFGEFCKTKFKGKHILATVNSVETEGENIVSVLTDKGTLTADLFIDATGFKGLLIGQALKEPFIPITDTLVNDIALTTRIPYKDKANEIEPCTGCTALSSGWVWNIPLWSRISSGYVYSSKFQSEQEAEEEYREHLIKHFGDRGERAELTKIKFKAGSYERDWVGNCCSLTLAAAFIEPLESTGIALTCFQIRNFLDAIKDGETSSFARSMFNEKISQSFKEIYDFVLLHYVNTKRDDSPYWRYFKDDFNTPKSLIKSLTADKKTPQKSTLITWFPPKSWDCIMLGLNIPGQYDSNNLLWDDNKLVDNLSSNKQHILANLEYLNERKKDMEAKARGMSSLYDYLNKEIYA
jgi:tryptophan halogenase